MAKSPKRIYLQSYVLSLWCLKITYQLPCIGPLTLSKQECQAWLYSLSLIKDEAVRLTRNNEASLLDEFPVCV